MARTGNRQPNSKCKLVAVLLCTDNMYAAKLIYHIKLLAMARLVILICFFLFL